MKSLALVLVVLTSLLLAACSQEHNNDMQHEQESLTIYSGITMVRPLSILAEEFEKKYQVNIEIKQGASGYLLKTLLSQQDADIFFPGSASYRIDNQDIDIWHDKVLVGYNRLAIMVAKGNPKNITADLNHFTDPNMSVVLSSPESGAVGRASKELFDQVGISKQVFANVTYFTTDSHRIYRALEQGHADISVNWYAASKWPETRAIMDAILLPETVAKPKKLELNLMKFAKNPLLAKQFLEFAASPQGLKVFAEYGFLTQAELDKLVLNAESRL